MMSSGNMYGEIPYVGKPVSRIIFGTAVSPLLAGQEEDELLDAVLAAGINTLDMARNYQEAENVVGKWMKKRGCRDRLVLISKCGHPLSDGTKRISESEIRKDFAESAEALGTDCIDIYLLHRDDPSVEAGAVIEIMNALYVEGKIRAFGGSNWSYRRIEEANEYAYCHGLMPFSVSSPNFGLAEQVADPWGGGCVSISGSQNQEARDWYRRMKMPIVAYSSLARGLFSGRVRGDAPEDADKILDMFAMKGYASPRNFERLRRCERLAAEKKATVAQIALCWIFKQNLNVFAVVGTTNAKRLPNSLDALKIELTPSEAEYLNLERDDI